MYFVLLCSSVINVYTFFYFRYQPADQAAVNITQAHTMVIDTRALTTKCLLHCSVYIVPYGMFPNTNICVFNCFVVNRLFGEQANKRAREQSVMMSCGVRE